ncbi:MAG: hypothetical protein IH599_05280, partial [Bacteroidales bacterium]|nr:hypothetical protein [Bacteroidales bacterium]
VDVLGGQSAEIELSFRLDEAGWHSGAVEITDYPVTYDDLYHLAFPVIEKIPVLSVFNKEPSSYIRALFAGDSLIDYQESAALSLDYASLSDFSLVILDGLNMVSSGIMGELQGFTESGGSLIVFPGDDADLINLNPFLASMDLAALGIPDTADTRVSALDPEHPLFGGVFEAISTRKGERIDLPQVLAHYPILLAAGRANEVLLGMDNSRPFLIGGHPGKGQSYLFSVPLKDEWSNLPRHAIVVPLLYRMAMLSRPLQNLSYTVGRDQSLRLPGISTLAEVITLKHLESRQEVIPEVRRQGSDLMLLTYDQIRNDGIYELSEKAGILGYAAFNYDRKESALDPLDAANLESMIEAQGKDRITVLNTTAASATEVIAQANQGVRYWKWLIWLALAFLLTEILLLRFMRA